jgi:hypothetical protein
MNGYTEIDLKETACDTVNCICRVGSIGGLLWTRQWTVGFRSGQYYIASQLTDIFAFYSFFFLVSWVGVRLSPLGKSATNWPIVLAPDDRCWMWSLRWNENWQEKPKYSEKTCPSATLSTTNPSWPDPGLNPGRRRGKPATNCLNYGTALPRRPGFEPRSGHVGYMVDKVTLGQVFSEYFGFPCQFSFHRLLHTHHHLSTWAGRRTKWTQSHPTPRKKNYGTARVLW